MNTISIILGLVALGIMAVPLIGLAVVALDCLRRSRKR